MTMRTGAAKTATMIPPGMSRLHSMNSGAVCHSCVHEWQYECSFLRLGDRYVRTVGSVVCSSP
jgi:hypothetical protein